MLLLKPWPRVRKKLLATGRGNWLTEGTAHWYTDNHLYSAVHNNKTQKLKEAQCVLFKGLVRSGFPPQKKEAIGTTTGSLFFQNWGNQQPSVWLQSNNWSWTGFSITSCNQFVFKFFNHFPIIYIHKIKETTYAVSKCSQQWYIISIRMCGVAW